jgi:hypothetical protein
MAHVEDEDVLPGVQPALQLFHLDGRHGHGHGSLLGADAAELLVVDQLMDGRIRSASRAFRILAQLEFAELHAHGVHHQQPPDE